jgi:acyl-CoA synthetase (NDP forming)
VKVVEECVNKGAKIVHVYSAGFTEMNSEEGAIRQKQLKAIINKSKTRLIGPNCLGVYSPSSRLTFDTRFSKQKGSIGFISQTGVGGRRLIYLANQRGLEFSKAISYGNALDLDAPDFLEYFITDPETNFILMYLEGVKQGKRLFNALRRCTKTKPVVMLKGGLSESGAKVVSSHTASLAGNRQIWQTLFKQTGVIPVETLEEAVEQMIAVVNIPPIRGRRVGLIGRGGGFGVIAADLCEKVDLSVPKFDEKTRLELAKLTPADAGSSVRNPVEIGFGRQGLSKYYSEAIKLVSSDDNIDFIITYLNPADYIHYGIGEWVDKVSEELIKAKEISTKPLIISFMPVRDIKVYESIIRIQDKCQESGTACFSSLDTAINATAKLISYYEFRDPIATSM